MISTDAMDSMLAKGKRALGRRDGRTVTTIAEISTANWKKRVHLLPHRYASMQPGFQAQLCGQEEGVQVAGCLEMFVAAENLLQWQVMPRR